MTTAKKATGATSKTSTPPVPPAPASTVNETNNETQTPPTANPPTITSTGTNVADATNTGSDQGQLPPVTSNDDETFETQVSTEPALEVVSFDGSFWRAGQQWTRTPRIVLLKDLTPAQISELKNEPLLNVREVLHPAVSK